MLWVFVYPLVSVLVWGIKKILPDSPLPVFTLVMTLILIPTISYLMVPLVQKILGLTAKTASKKKEQKNGCDQRLYLMARIAPKAEYFDAAKQAVAAIIPATSQEQGVDRFRLHEGEEDGAQILYLYETFQNEKALAYHYQQDYTKEVFEKYQNWLAEPVKIWKMQYIAG